MSNNYFLEHKDDIFRKYTDTELSNEVYNYIFKNGELKKVLIHFFDECMYKAVGTRGQLYNSKFPEKTPWDALNSDAFVEEMLNYINKHPEFYNSDNVYSNIRSFFRNNHPRKVANFPVQSANEIIFSFYKDFNIMFDEPLNIHDSSCGFGSRMSSVVLKGCNYFGTDPNVELYECLNKCFSFYKKTLLNLCGEKDIRNIGSEIFIPEWENKMDISFTSPPYFNLEIYSNDNYSSSKNYDNYSLWVEEYMIPTCTNISKYLKNNGYVAINIKNLSDKEPIFDDFVKCFTKIGLTRLEDKFLNIKSKSFNNKETFTEPIMVFQKI